MKQNIVELSKVIRSKNCSPFELTIDIILKDRLVYERIKKHNEIDRPLIALLYKVNESCVRKIFYFDPANAIKITMERAIASGAPGDTDVYGAQQHAPLLSLIITI